MTTPAIRLVLLTACLLMPLPGCSVPLAQEPGPEVMQAWAAAPATAPVALKPGADLSPLRPGTWTYKYEGNEFDGDVSTLRTEQSEEDPNVWLRHADEYKQTRYLRSDGKGGVVMSKVVDRDRNAVTIFEPAIPVLKVDMPPNTPVTYESHANVAFLSNPKMQMDSGTCRMTIEHDGDQKLTTPAGTFQVKRFKLKFETDFKFADVNSIAWIYYADNIGIIAEYYAEEGRAFVVPWSKKRTIILTDYTKP